MKRGNKIHWSSEGIYFSPCGMSTTYYKSVSVEKFKNVPIDERCKRCNNAFNIHLSNFLEVDTILKRHILLDTYWLILSCEYYKNSSNPYKDLIIHFIEFNGDLNNIKSGRASVGMGCSAPLHERICDMTTEKITYIKRLCKLIEG